MNKLIELHQVYKTYGNTHQTIEVLQGISLSIDATTRVVISGESGSGKTTLLSVISGLDTIDSGNITIAHTNISELNEEKKAEFRLSHLGFVFQYHYLLQDFNALGNVMLPLQMSGMKKKNASEQAHEMLEKVGLAHRHTHYPSQLSGGECQRVAIARAMVHKPTLILADEPTGALDSKNSIIIRDLLCQLVEEQSCTLLIASHDKNFLPIADQHFMFQADGTLQAQS